MRQGPTAEPAWQARYDVASSQDGLLTTRQAAVAGCFDPQLSHHPSSGRLTRMRRGIDRLVPFPASEHHELVAAWLRRLFTAVISFQFALSLHGRSDLLLAQIHLSLPTIWRRRRLRVPKGLVLHFADAGAKERTSSGSVPTTSVRRTLADCAGSGLTPDLLLQGARKALTRGLITGSD